MTSVFWWLFAGGHSSSSPLQQFARPVATFSWLFGRLSEEDGQPVRRDTGACDSAANARDLSRLEYQRIAFCNHSSTESYPNKEPRCTPTICGHGDSSR